MFALSVVKINCTKNAKLVRKLETAERATT